MITLAYTTVSSSTTTKTAGRSKGRKIVSPVYVQDSDEYVPSSISTKSGTYAALYRDMADPASEEAVVTDPDEYVYTLS